MIQTIILFIAVLLFVYGVTSIITNIISSIHDWKDSNLLPRVIITAIGLTYILWYCN